MTALILALLLNSSAADGTHHLRLVDTEDRWSEDAPTARKLMIDDDRPSLGPIVALLSGGALLATAGTGGVGFGLVMIILSGNSLFSEVAVVLGVMIGGAGLLVLGAGIVCAMVGFRKLRERGEAEQWQPSLSLASPGSPVDRAPAQLVTVATF